MRLFRKKVSKPESLSPDLEIISAVHQAEKQVGDAAPLDIVLGYLPAPLEHKQVNKRLRAMQDRGFINYGRQISSPDWGWYLFFPGRDLCD